MRCPSCGHENRETAKFCGECTAPLTQEVACARCGTLNPARQKFCDSCGTDLEAARAELVACLGETEMVDAASVIGNFQRMVRIADSTGIPVDGLMAEANADVRQQLGLNELPSARLA